MKILSVFGTRPEAIKMAPVVNEINSNKSISGKVCITGQHKEMLRHVLDFFNIHADYDLNLTRTNDSLSGLVSSLISNLDPVLMDCQPELILVHGDTSTTMAACVSAFHRKIPVAHVEAGLRTGNLLSPWPEEGNRKIVGALARLHFAPTQRAEQNLINENIDQKNIHVTGNTVIDSLLMTSNTLENDSTLKKEYERRFSFLDVNKKLILVTAHRRESFGEGFERICQALKIIAESRDDVEIVYPVHLNPNVQKPVFYYLGSSHNIYLIDPQEYLPFVYLMKRSYLILTDSGGIQEEAPSLKKPVLVLRDNTERPEAIEAGTVKLVGTDVQKIVKNVMELLASKDALDDMISRKNPYGDGLASKRIVEHILKLSHSF